MITYSVVIPTYNRPRQLEDCLRALAASDYPRELLEFVVVDDGSPQEAEVAAVAARFGARLLRQQQRGPAAARNRGAALAKGDYLAFTDDDCQVAPDWLRVLGRVLEASPGCGAGGLTRNALRDNACSAASQHLLTYLYGHYNQAGGVATFLTTNNLALPAAQFHSMGGFNEKFTRAASEDRDLCNHWLQRGHGLLYVPEAVVYHRHAMTMRKFWQQHFDYGRGARRYHLSRAERGQARPRLESLRFYTRMMAFPFTKEAEEAWTAAIPQSALIFLSQVAHTAGYAAERWQGAESGVEHEEGK